MHNKQMSENKKKGITLYPHQEKAVRSMERSKGIGQILLPTGTGKTIAMAEHLRRSLKKKGRGPSVAVVVAPRILLGFQLAYEFNTHLSNNFLSSTFMYVHSGGSGNQEDINRVRKITKTKHMDIQASTNSAAVAAAMTKAKNERTDLILFTTYESLARITTAAKRSRRKIDITYFDEAHHLVQENYNDSLTKFAKHTSQQFFFTATAKKTTSDQSTGMNNEDKYGPILYEMTIGEAIKDGRIVRPRLHTVGVDNVHTTEDYKTSIPKIISTTLSDHVGVLNEQGSQPNQAQAPKLLVTITGTKDIERFFESNYCHELVEEGYKVFAISARHGPLVDSLDNKLKRPRWLARLKSAINDPEEKVLVLHYDILSEGIDASGFTGCLLLRSMPVSTFCQNFGRISRLHPKDRAAFRNASYTPEDLEQMIKPYAYVIVPRTTSANMDMSEMFTEIVKGMRTIGMRMDDFVCTSNQTSGHSEESDDEFLDDVDEALQQKIGEEIRDLYAEIEDKEDANRLMSMSDDDYFGANDDNVFLHKVGKLYHQHH
jgi:predicted helicase